MLRPKALVKWENSFPDNTFNWNFIFTTPFVVARDAKIQYFQFRYLHRIIGTNDFLFRIKIKDSPLCSFCKVENETLEHLFWFCPNVRRFWEEICTACLREKINLNEKSVHSGYTEKKKSIINFFIFYAKYFIFFL